MTHSKKDAISELKRELYMRLKVWRTADKENHRFLNPEHQHQFDTLLDLSQKLECLTDKEWAKLEKRKAEHQRLNEAQHSLF